MRIIRFIDKNGKNCYGQNHRDGSATVMDGDIINGLTDTGRETEVFKLLAPVSPQAILGIGLNYRDHASETGMPLPEHPILFMKNPGALSHPGDPIVIPKSCSNPPQVDFEVELAVVIGRSAKDVSADDALDYVLGYTIANDVSARRWQKHGGGMQWVRGKSFDSFCPLGPVLVTKDEIPDPQTLRLQSHLNGTMMQDSSTADMIFSVAELIQFLSEGTTLLPGTVILTGTPSGVGFTRNPPIYLKPGDSLTFTIENIGELRNPVVGFE